MPLVRLPLSGGCQCGRQRYRITALPLSLYACHCRECQKQSSSAFGLSMPVPREAFECDMERLAHWTRMGASGRQVVTRFCPECGSRLFHEPARDPALVNVKPGCLDDNSWIEPVGHLWLSRAQPWFQPPKESLTYPEQPTNFEALFARFAKRFAEASADDAI